MKHAPWSLRWDDKFVNNRCKGFHTICYYPAPPCVSVCLQVIWSYGLCHHIVWCVASLWGPWNSRGHHTSSVNQCLPQWKKLSECIQCDRGPTTVSALPSGPYNPFTNLQFVFLYPVVSVVVDVSGSPCLCQGKWQTQPSKTFIFLLNWTSVC